MTEPSRLSYDAIRAYAERIGAHHEVYDDTGRADVDLLLEKVGGVIEFHDSNESMNVEGHGRFRIFLPSFTSSRRDRFTKAHELAHYFLHYLEPGVEGAAVFHRGGRSLAETQANVFASSLLMPEGPFRAAWADLGSDFWRLAERFDVSPAAAEVRAKVLSLV